jgi:hypothetical protein
VNPKCVHFLLLDKFPYWLYLASACHWSSWQNTSLLGILLSKDSSPISFHPSSSRNWTLFFPDVQYSFQCFGFRWPLCPIRKSGSVVVGLLELDCRRHFSSPFAGQNIQWPHWYLRSSVPLVLQLCKEAQTSPCQEVVSSDKSLSPHLTAIASPEQWVPPKQLPWFLANQTVRHCSFKLQSFGLISYIATVIRIGMLSDPNPAAHCTTGQLSNKTRCWGEEAKNTQKASW